MDHVEELHRAFNAVGREIAPLKRNDAVIAEMLREISGKLDGVVIARPAKAEFLPAPVKNAAPEAVDVTTFPTVPAAPVPMAPRIAGAMTPSFGPMLRRR